MTFFSLNVEITGYRQRLKSVEEAMSANVAYFKMKCFAYSDIEDGVIFYINLTIGKVTSLNDNPSAVDLEVD